MYSGEHRWLPSIKGKKRSIPTFGLTPTPYHLINKWLCTAVELNIPPSPHPLLLLSVSYGPSFPFTFLTCYINKIATPRLRPVNKVLSIREDKATSSYYLLLLPPLTAKSHLFSSVYHALVLVDRIVVWLDRKSCLMLWTAQRIEKPYIWWTLGYKKTLACALQDAYDTTDAITEREHEIVSMSNNKVQISNAIKF